MLPIALDAMGGDHAPSEIVSGARLALEEHGIPIMLVGRPEELGDTTGFEVLPASEVIAMDAEPGKSVRTMKDSSLVRAAQAVRDGQASAMVSAGNTGAAMASALLRMGRIKGAQRSPLLSHAYRAARSCCSTRARTPTVSPSGSCSSLSWARSMPIIVSGLPALGLVCCPSVRKPARGRRS